MKYMMLVYMNEQAMTDEERAHCYVESAQVTQDLNAKGQYLGAGPLHPVATATSVRVRDGKRVVTDGPFAETREQLGGYYVIEAKDLDEAAGAIWNNRDSSGAGNSWTAGKLACQKPARQQGRSLEISLLPLGEGPGMRA